MKLIFFIAFSFFLGTAQANVNATEKSDLKWYTDLDKAHEASTKEGKPIFGFFTGSDWCGWCTLLQKNVFAKEAFITWAKKNVILLELDFPKRTPQSPELKKQNQNMQKAFGVRGYPTVWIFDSSKNADTGAYNLTRIGKLGYPSGAKKGKEEVKFLESANQILALKKK